MNLRGCKTYAVLGVLLAIIIYEGRSASASSREPETASLVFGKFHGQSISEQGEIYRFNWKSAKWKMSYIQVYNIDTNEKKPLHLNSIGFFTLKLDPGNYQLRKKNSKQQVRRTGKKYNNVSDFSVPEQSLVNLGTYKILTGEAKLKSYKIKTSYQIQHREDHEAYEETVAWLKENKPDLLEKYGGKMICPFPHGPGNELYSLGEDPDQVIRDLFGFVPGRTIMDLIQAYFKRTKKGKFTVSTKLDGSGEMLYVAQGPLANLCDGINCAKNSYLTDDKMVKAIQIDIDMENIDKQNADTQLSKFEALASEISKVLGDSHYQTKKEKNQKNILKGIIQGENHYRMVWGFDDYTVALGLGGSDRKIEDREMIYLSVFYEPAMIE